MSPQPAAADAIAIFAEALRHHQAGELDAAASLYRQALTLKPDFVDAANNLGAASRGLGRYAEAMEAYLQAIAAKPDYAEAHQNLGIVLRELGRLDEAVASFVRAIELRPDYAKAYVNLGVALQELGRGAEALEAFDVGLILDPISAHAWHARSDLKTFTPDDPDIARMRSALGAMTVASDQTLMHFALGKAFMDAGDADDAFAHLDHGNRLKRETFDYDVTADLAAFGEIAATSTPALMARIAGGGDASNVPIFVIGMPRSGTTLVEQVLASHAQVHGAGELGQLQGVIDDHLGVGVYPAGIAKLAPSDITALGRDYVSAIMPLANVRARVVDKMPGNFRYAGLISAMLPNARIVHCRRDPVDTCLSCYSKLFTGHQAFTYDLAELGRYYRGYEALMGHWRAVLPPERFLDVDYEDLVDDLEAEARRLVAFCGLDWDPACLSFHQTRRQVRTASASQVRRPLYRSSVGRWRPYERHLGPLLEALGGPGTSPK